MKEELINKKVSYFLKNLQMDLALWLKFYNIVTTDMFRPLLLQISVW